MALTKSLDLDPRLLKEVGDLGRDFCLSKCHSIVGCVRRNVVTHQTVEIRIFSEIKYYSYSSQT